MKEGKEVKRIKGAKESKGAKEMTESKEIKEELLKRKNCLLHMKRNLQERTYDNTEGSLRINGSGNRVQYFHKMKGGNVLGTYIPKKNIALAQTLAQKEYERKVLRSIEQEVKAIEKYLSSIPQNTAEEIYNSLHIERQKLIRPVRETDAQFVRRWETFAFRGKEIEESVPVLLTEKGEQVRSKSEMIIADLLYSEGIPYRYECPLYLEGYGKVYPDFTVLNIRKRKEMYWEHLGMMDDANYIEKALRKIGNYEKNGIVLGDSLILTWETKSIPISRGIIRTQIERHMK